MSYSEPPAMKIDTGKQYAATIETEKGNLELELFAKDVPVTVNNFVFLAREGFYDNTTFHRVIADLWLREATLQEPGQAALVTDLPMNLPTIPTKPECYQWLMPGLTPMALSFL